MRKSLLITVLGLCISLFAQSSATYDSRSGDVIIVDDIGKKVVLESFIATKGAFDEASLQSVVSKLTKLPTSILTQLYESGVRIVIKEKCTKNVPGGTAGTYSPTRKKVTIIADGGTSRHAVSPHEVGHAVDFDGGMLSKEKAFLTMYKSEGEKLFPERRGETSYYLSNELEYFAESFNVYFSGGGGREKMKVLAPQTFNYFENIERDGYQSVKSIHDGVKLGTLIVVGVVLILSVPGVK